jgi:hypothetical protein
MQDFLASLTGMVEVPGLEWFRFQLELVVPVSQKLVASKVGRCSAVLGVFIFCFRLFTRKSFCFSLAYVHTNKH